MSENAELEERQEGAQGARSRKPKGRGHERRDEILDAAARLFIENGFENVSTRRIAVALGISQTTLYVYFATKDAILEALCERCFMHLVALFDRVASSTDEPVEKLRRLMHGYVEFGLLHSDEYRIAFMLSQHHRADKYKNFSETTELQPQGIQCFLKLQEQVALLGEFGLLRQDPATVAQAIWAAGHGLVALLITMPKFPWIDRADLVDTLIDIQFRGILAGPPE